MGGFYVLCLLGASPPPTTSKSTTPIGEGWVSLARRTRPSIDHALPHQLSYQQDAPFHDWGHGRLKLYFTIVKYNGMIALVGRGALGSSHSRHRQTSTESVAKIRVKR
jgi:hypothetical protein